MPKISDYEPEVVSTAEGDFLRWAIPYRKKDGSDGTAYVAMLSTLENYHSSPFSKQDLQVHLDKFIETNA